MGAVRMTARSLLRRRVWGALAVAVLVAVAGGAVLAALAGARRQVGPAVAWQATTLVVVALALGVPLGLVAGRLVWRSFADELGVGAGVVLPALAFTLIAVSAVVLANLIAAFPARTAARTRPALVLRSE